jgi:nucleoside-diphosphate-sugar epimerase
MKVLVIGSTGVVGRQLVPRLVAEAHDVVTTSRSAPREPTLGVSVEHHRLDLLDHSAVVGLVRSVRPDTIVHLATALSGLGNNLRRFDRAFAVTNRLRTEGTASLIAAARHSGGQPRLIAQSFCGWPWQPSGGPVKSEDEPLDPDPPKPFRRTFRAIVQLERLVTAYEHGVVLRFAALYGPGTSLSTGGAQVEAVRAGRFPMFGDAKGTWSFLHVGDAASAVAAALHRGTGVYNIADDDPATVAEWLPELARIIGVPPPRRAPLWLGRLVGGEGLVRLMTNVRGSTNQKARCELAWAPRFSSWRQGFSADLRTRELSSR